MANGAFKFKDNSGNVVSYISGSGSNISFSGGTLDLSGMTGLTLGSFSISGSIQSAQSASLTTNVVGTSNRVLFNNATNTTTTSPSLTWDGSKLAVSGNISFGYNSTLQDSIDSTNNISLHDGSYGIMKLRTNSVDKIAIGYGASGNITVSGSIMPAVSASYDLGSVNYPFRHLYLSSASLYVNGTKVLGSTSQELQITTDAGQSFKILESGSDTITLQSADGNITIASSGGGDVVLDPTNGIIGLKGTTTVYTGNKIVSSDGNSIQFGNGIAITGSIVSTVTPLVSGSVQLIGFGFATTGSNNFVGTQTITGSLYISQNLIVQGSSSLQDVTGSNVYIGTNKINLNTNTPGIRFGGLSVFDSGSNFGESGSLLWDSTNNRWIYQHPSSSGAPYKSAIIISGPQNSGALGSETGLTTGKIQKAVGDDHIGDSIITETGGGGVGISGSLSITGSIVSTGNSTIGGYYTFSSWTTGTINKIRGYSGNDDKSIQWNYDNSPAGTVIRDNNSILLSINSGNTISATSAVVSTSTNLNVTGSITNRGVIIDGANNSNIATLNLTRTDNSWGINNETNLRVYVGSGNTTSPSTKVLELTAGGSMGLGTSSTPSHRLTVQADSADMISWRSPTFINGILGLDTNNSHGALWLLSSGTTKVQISSLSSSTTYFNAGNVAVGATSAGYKLDVQSSSSGVFGSTFNGAWSSGYLNHSYFMAPSLTGGAVSLAIGVASSSYNVGKVVFNYSGNGNTGNSLGLGFWDNDNVLRVLANGNVYIGSPTNPGTGLSLTGCIQAGRSNANFLDPGASGNVLGGTTFFVPTSYDSSNNGYIRISQDSSTISFTTDWDGHISGGTLKTIIFKHGQVGNGVQLTNGATSWSSYTSDARTKTIHRTIENTGLETISKLNGVVYTMSKVDEKYGADTKLKIGFTAQNVQEAIPEAVFTSYQDEELGDVLTYTPDYIIPYLVESIKELKEILRRNNLS